MVSHVAFNVSCAGRTRACVEIAVGSQTRRSTPGGVVVLGTEMKPMVSNAITVSSSSAVRRMVEGLYVQNLLSFRVAKLERVLYADSSAATGHCSRLSNGKRPRRFQGAALCTQQVLRATLTKIHGKPQRSTSVHGVSAESSTRKTHERIGLQKSNIK